MVSPYKKVKIDGRTLQAHRVVWEAEHGPIPDGHVVHHIDHDKRNNDLSNLMLMTYQEHSEHHNQKHAVTKVCPVCDGEFIPPPTKRSRKVTCSRECFKAHMSRVMQGNRNGTR